MFRKAFFVVLPLGASLLLAQEAAPPPDSQEAPPPVFPGEVEQVTVDVVITDKKGVPIRGLTQGDFEVYEDGKRQEVVSFEAFEVPPAPSATPKARPKVSTNQELEDTKGRTFVVLFDDMHLTPAEAYQAKGAVADFLKNGVREGDRVTLVATLAGAWWSTRMEAGRDELIALLKRLEGRHIPDRTRARMTEYEAMRIHVDRDIELAQRVQRRFNELGVVQMQQVSPQQNRYFSTSIDPYVSQRAAEVYLESTARNRTTLAILERSLEALNATRGRKSLIMVSAGFVYDRNLQEFRWVSQAARRANTAIYFVNAKGLEALPYELTAEFGAALPEIDLGWVLTDDFWDAEGTEALAIESGGFIISDTNDLSGGFQRIADENSSYYLLGYNPTNTARDGLFRKISVKVPGGKDLKIRARKGYYAPGPDGEPRRRGQEGVDPVFQEALDSPHEISDVPLRMTHFVGAETILGKAQVGVVTEVDLRALELEGKGGRYEGGVEFLLVVVHRETGEFSRYDQKLELRLLPATRERLMKTWLPIRREFELPPGGHQAKIVVRDVRTGRVGTVVHEFEVADLDQFRISTPVLTDTRREATDSRAEVVVPVARRDFTPGQQLFCQLEVYGAERDGSGMPRVAMGYEVRREDGSVFAARQPTEILPTSLGNLSWLFRFSLQGAEPGDYELVLALHDRLSGKSLEVTEPFTVQAGSVPELASAQPGG